MARCVVENEEGVRLGWFDDKAARSWEEETYFDGHNHIGMAGGGQWHKGILYLTAQKKHWVRYYPGTRGRHVMLSAREARDWFLACEYWDEIGEFFPGSLEEAEM